MVISDGAAGRSGGESTERHPEDFSFGGFCDPLRYPAVGSEPEPDCVDLASQGTFFFSVHDSLAWARGSGGHLGPEAGS